MLYISVWKIKWTVFVWKKKLGWEEKKKLEEEEKKLKKEQKKLAKLTQSLEEIAQKKMEKLVG